MPLNNQNANNQRVNIRILKIMNSEQLNQAEHDYRYEKDSRESMPWAKDTKFIELAENVLPDKNGPWNTPLFYSMSIHRSVHGMSKLARKAIDYIKTIATKSREPIDIMSVSTRMQANGRILLNVLVRPYSNEFDFTGFFDEIGDPMIETVDSGPVIHTGKLIIPDEIKNFKYTEEQIEKHDEEFDKQEKILDTSDKEHPFLNQIDHYVPKHMPLPEDSIDPIYDLKTADKSIQLSGSYDNFIKVFQEVMTYVNGVEYYHYLNAVKGDESEESFMDFLDVYIRQNYINKDKFYSEDLKPLKDKLYRSLFQLYVVQDLIDDPNVTDVKITAPDTIRARVKGKAYISNITFIDLRDYLRFVNMIAMRNGILQTVPSQTFTDTHDKNYILRFSLTAAYVNSLPWPYLHIRKISRRKMMAPDLIKAGMFDEKIRDYLIDCGKTSRGVVFAGPPGSGKTVILNWFIEEAYEQSAEILVIQENDELFAYRKGVMFEHVVNYANGNETPVNLEQLGQLALVAGANVFVIGEAKGAEICSAITLSNSGCRTALTIHSPSSTETIDKMADLAMRGYAQDYDQAKRMLKSFQTIVYLQDFQVKEISEITGYDEDKHEMTYRYIYRKEE